MGGGGAGHLASEVGIHINVLTADQLAVALKDLLTGGVVRHYLSHPTGSVLKVHQPPAFTLTGIDTHISCLVDRLQQVHRYRRWVGCIGGHDDASVGIQAPFLHLSCKDRHHIPALVLGTHV